MALALLLDALAGDLPNRWHPVAWMGTAINTARRYAPVQGTAAQFLYGAAVVLSGAIGAGALGQALLLLCRKGPQPLGWLVETALLKQTVALAGLARAAQAVYTPLVTGDEAEARRQLSWHLVSRDTAALDTARISAATIESVAENSSDGVIAPLFYYVVAGLPGALVYRWLNTVDSLWGYRDASREWLGKAGARADDLANWLPARLTALLLLIAASLLGNLRQAWRIWRRDAHLTTSPNAGQPMSAMAGALEVELEKVGHYRLGAGLALPQASDIPRAVALMRGAVIAAMALCGMAILIRQI
jgi:adenosylcobinamide-phosphate synthase